MNERLFWTLMAQWVACGAAICVLLLWPSMQRDRRPAADERATLRMPWAYAIAGAIGLCAFLGGWRLSYVYAAEWRHPATDAVFLLFAAISLWALADFVFLRIRVDAEGLATRSPTGRWRTMAWADVRDVRYSTMLNCFRVRTADGRRANVPTTAIGLPTFARSTLRYAPADAFDARTRDRLADTAEGRPPPIW